MHGRRKSGHIENVILAIMVTISLSILFSCKGDEVESSARLVQPDQEDSLGCWR